MPITTKHLGFNFVLGIWEISESLVELQKMIVLNENEQKKFNAITVEKKKLQWLAARILNNKLLGKRGFIVHDEHGNPSLRDSDQQISISHSELKVAVLIHNEKNVGIDIQQIHPKIGRIKHKFLNENELNFAENSGNPLELMTLFWSIKEAIFKIFGSEVIFKDIKIHPQTFENGSVFTVLCRNTLFNVFCERAGEYFLAYVIE